MATLPPRKIRATRKPIVSVPALNTRSKSTASTKSLLLESPDLPLHRDYPLAAHSPLPYQHAPTPRFDASERAGPATSAPPPAMPEPPASQHRPSKKKNVRHVPPEPLFLGRQSTGDCHEETYCGDKSTPPERHDQDETGSNQNDLDMNINHNSCQAPDPWVEDHVHNCVVPKLPPHAALQAVKLFVGTARATANLDTARELVESLDPMPSWDETSIQNLLVLVAMILPNHVVIGRPGLERLVDPGRESVEQDAPRQSVEDHRAEAVPRKRKTLVEAWWSRFLRIKLDDIRSLPPSVEEMLNQDPVDTIASLNLFDMSTDVAHPTSAKQQQMLSTRILFMYNRGMSDAVRLIMHIFFYAVMYHPDPDRWRVDLRSGKKRLARLATRDIDALYAHFISDFPNVSITRESFDEQLRDWRRLGSVYLFLAQRLGLGSLLYLQEFILPSRCWGATKGGEKGGISETALEHLEEIGLPELCEETGANHCVRALLGQLCQGFGTFNFGDLDAGDGARPSPEV